MIFADISDGASVFLDANTFVYHFAADPVYKTPCTQLLDRIEQKLVHGFTSTHVVTEIAHRLMTLEAIDAYGWPSTGIAARLRRRPSEVQKLVTYRTAIQILLASKVGILTIAPHLAASATSFSHQWGLLSSDALIVAIMQAHGLTNLASNDSDFDRVVGLVRFSPQ
jgi:predicted nucleic acid-binding protein